MTILVETFSTGESGPVFSLGMVKGLQANGVSVYGIIPKQAENIEEWKNSIEKEKVYIWEGVPQRKRIASYLFNLIMLFLHFRKVHFDYVIINNPYNADIIISKLLRVHNRIIIFHDPIPHSGKDSCAEQHVKKYMPYADKVLVLSKIFIPEIVNKYGFSPEDVLYMRHGLMSYPAYSGVHDKKYDANSVNFLFFGRIDQYKGLHVLARAYAMVSEKYENISLTIAGNGDFSPYHDEYSKLKNTEVINRYVTNEKIAELFTRPNTVLVLPYLDATQSGVIGMAYNYGLPIIVSDTGGLREQLLDGAAGIFVKPGDVDDLVQKMRSIIDCPAIIEQQKNKMANSRDLMQWDSVVKDFLKELV